MACGPRPHDTAHPAERAVRFDRRREGRDEPGLLERVEAVLPPQTSDAERIVLALDPRLDPADQPVAEEDGQDVVAPAALRGRDVDLPQVVEPIEAAQEVAIPDERIERGEERNPRRRPAGRRPSRDLALRLLEERHLLGQREPRTADPFDHDRDERPVGDQLSVERTPAAGLERQPVLHADLDPR